MEEQLRAFCRVKSRNEMKTINVVFVSDDLVGQTIVNRKEYDRALKQKVKTDVEKQKVEETGVVTPSKGKKRKTSEDKEEGVSAKKSKIDDVESALAALVEEEEEEEEDEDEDEDEDDGEDDVEKEVVEKKTSGKKDAGKKDSCKKDSIKRDSSRRDPDKRDGGRKDGGRKDSSKRDSSRTDSGKKDSGKRDSGRKDSSKRDSSKTDSGKKESSKTHKEQKDSGKTDTGKNDSGKKATDKNESAKTDPEKKDVEKKDATRKGIEKESAGKEDVHGEDVGKEGVDEISAKLLLKMMGDEEDVSASADSNFEILSLESYIRGEGSSESWERGMDSPKSTTGQGKGTKEKQVPPYRLRKRVIKDIKKIQRILENSDVEDNDPSSSESELLDSSSEESESGKYEESEEKERQREMEMDMEIEMEKEKEKEKENEDEDVDENENEKENEKEKEKEKEPVACSSSSINYFEAQSSSRNITSDNTLKNLKNPTLNHKELNKIVGKCKISPGHRNAIKSLINESIMLFSKWDFLLKNNFNILLYGLGSKREIVNNFVERFAKKYPLILVNGFFPDLSIRDITEKICRVLEIAPGRTDVTSEINRKLNEYHVEIYIVVNNIDGLMLRNKKTQTILSQYARMDGIHMLATIDHINAPLMWDKSTFSDFNWLWYDATTFLNYTEEVVYEGNIMLQNSGKLTLSSLRNVYNALTRNSRSIFLLMVKRELKNPLSMARGVSFKELYQACRKELLISSDVGLRTLLKEFIDHGILKQKKTSDGEEVFVITVENNILQQFVEDQERR